MSGLEPCWQWLILGALLGAAEIIMPGFFLMWLAIAALITGALAFLLPISVSTQIVVFAALAIAAVYAGRRYMLANPIISDDPKLNDRGARLTGQIVQVVEAIEGGSGRVKVGDGVWSARGEDCAAGTRVRVTGIESGTLLVEAL